MRRVCCFIGNGKTIRKKPHPPAAARHNVCESDKNGKCVRRRRDTTSCARRRNAKTNLDPPPETNGMKNKFPNDVRRSREIRVIKYRLSLLLLCFFFHVTTVYRLGRCVCVRLRRGSPSGIRSCVQTSVCVCVVKVNRRTIAFDEKGRRWRKRTHLVVSGSPLSPVA